MGLAGPTGDRWGWLGMAGVPGIARDRSKASVTGVTVNGRPIRRALIERTYLTKYSSTAVQL